jgi:hypothetical protein
MCAQSGSRTSIHSALISLINPELQTVFRMRFRAPHNMFRVPPNKPIHDRACQSKIAGLTAGSSAIPEPTLSELDRHIKLGYGADHSAIIGVLSGKNKLNENTVRGASVELKELFGNQKRLIAMNGLIYRDDKGNSQLLYQSVCVKR